ncbi:sensor histidine kinase [Hymenobacter algoricola]|uniref:histidine kinase n=1 Tax=Hymenobacter algoricola TaxID=486267 RepID=A0ABP7MY95_9BACT
MDNLYGLILLSIVGTFSMVVFFVLIHFRNQTKLAKQAEQMQKAQLQYQIALLEAVIRSQETERKRIGQNLHDDVGTVLANLRMTVEMYQQAAGTPASLALFTASCKTIIDKVINEVRHISHNLSPVSLDLYGFTDAVEELADLVNNAGKLRFSLQNEAGPLLDQLSSTHAAALYRIVEELLNNTLKHSGASQIHLGFGTDENALLVSYQDNGQGITPKPGQRKAGMGTSNIESRLAIMQASHTVRAAPGQGFAFKARIPLQAVAAPAHA